MRIIVVYLLATAFVTTINGLMMHLSGGISAIGPIFHGLYSLCLIALGICHPGVKKNWLLIFIIYGLVLLIVIVQVYMGFSDGTLRDIGQLYKWYMPVMLFAVYYRWEYVRTSEGQKTLSRVFQKLPLIYSGLIIFSASTYFLFGFNPTLFPDGTLRFTGFSWGYNSTINVFFICGYVNYLFFQSSTSDRLVNLIAFLLLNSKTAVAYFALVAWSYVERLMRSLKLRQKTVILLIALPFLTAVIGIGYKQSLRAADASGDFTAAGQEVDSTLLLRALTNSRFAWYSFMWDDVADWPIINLMFGNGTNVDRRKLNPLWDIKIGSNWYSDAKLDKTDKAIELDVLGHLDMLGLLAAIVFALVFYVYPFYSIKLPRFYLYQIFLIILSMLGGHMINNPQTGVLIVFFYLFLSGYSHSQKRINVMKQK